MDSPAADRRRFLVIAAASAGACLAGLPGRRALAEEKEEEVTPTEDLMREHGLLNRVLLVYEEGLRRLEGKGELDPRPFRSAAEVIKTFIEDYHEKLEEDHLFPRFEKAGKLADLVKVLREQHQAGRRLTAETLSLLSGGRGLSDEADRRKLAGGLRGFIRMYRPHEAREDTVLFPELRSIVSAHEYAALGEDFEKKEHQLFGEEGFEKMVDKVGGIEKELGIYELSQFTPRA